MTSNHSTTGSLPQSSDVVIIGGGLVGLATAYALTRRQPSLSVTVVEKEPTVAAHQSGRNSGVIHSGVYYSPGSDKATLCRRGRRLLLAFAEDHGVSFEVCGKVIVATEPHERSALAEIAERGRANGVDAELIGPDRLAELEPAVAGIEALHVPDAGIVDFPAVAATLVDLLGESDVNVVTGAAVISGRETSGTVRVCTTAGDVTSDVVVGCAGLHSDRVAAMFSSAPLPVRIVPFRGEYFALCEQAASLCNNLIYPVPDPRYPFLGVHLTRHISGQVLAGPNAVPALSREGYDWTKVSLADLRDTLGFPGARKLAVEHWRTGAEEMWRSLYRPGFVRALQRMTPDIRSADLIPYPAGVRAQAVHADGKLADDFIFHATPRTVHVLNAPSPAATSSLAIGESLVEQILARTT